MTYIQYFIEDYDPEAKEEYKKELAEFMNKLEKDNG
jgi:ABC-type Zn uptake system ZnuABC Zn-binding protein ZnuA